MICDGTAGGGGGGSYFASAVDCTLIMVNAVFILFKFCVVVLFPPEPIGNGCTAAARKAGSEDIVYLLCYHIKRILCLYDNMSSAALPSATSMQEAASRPLEYDPATRASYIRSMVRDISTMVLNGETEEAIRGKVGSFAEQYPELLKKLLKRENLTPMYDMLSLLDKMGDGKLSQHEASIVIGKSLVDRFVTPQLQNQPKRE